MWLKVCGMTNEAAVAAALESGVDAIGFVFAPSVRRVTPRRAAELAAPARGRVVCVAVTQHPEPGLIAEILDVFGPDLLQTDLQDIATLGLQGRCALLPVLRHDVALPQPLPPRLLFEGPVSGSGQTADWSRARGLAAGTELVLAGGSGYGPPEERSEPLLAMDCQLGFVSDAGARQDYGRDGRPATPRAQALPALATASACPSTLVP